MDRTRIGRRVALALGTSVLLVGTVATSAFAADAVTQAVTAGTRTASVANLALSSTAYNHSQHDITGTMVLTADDSTGSNAGWNVTIQTSAFVWTVGSGGASSGTNIPAVNFALTPDPPMAWADSAVGRRKQVPF